jgi:hypothetical protein
MLSSVAPAHHVVWFAIDHARLNRFPTLTVEPVEFFHADILKAWMVEKSQALPLELLNANWPIETGMPEGPETLFARVDVGMVNTSDPVGDARRVLRNLLAIAKFEVGLSGRTAWRLLSGYWQAVDGHLVGFEVIEDRDELAVYREAYEAVGHHLETIMANRLESIAFSEDLDSLISWMDRALEADSPMATLLYVRVIETLSARTAETNWKSLADQILKSSWIRQEIMGTVIGTVRRSIGVLGRISLQLDPSLASELDEITKTVFRWLPGLRYEAQFDQAASSLGTIARAAPAHSAFRREVEYLQQRLAGPGPRSRWIKELSLKWRLIRDRLDEVRNEVTHAEAPTERVSDTVIPFASFTARRLTLELLDAAKANRPFRDSGLASNAVASDWLDNFTQSAASR